MRPRVAAIVPSAGCGKRLGLRTKKPFVLVNGVPLVIRTLKKLNNSSAIDAIIVAVERACIGRLERLVKDAGLNKVGAVLAGGATRFESVRNCLAMVDDSFDIVLVHDGARPFVEDSMIHSCVEKADKFGASIVAVQESDTVKFADRNLFIKRTLDRSRVYRAQTPQAFRTELLKKAYAARGARSMTDDSGLVEALGKKVKIVEGSYMNIKITTKEDIHWAEVLL